MILVSEKLIELADSFATRSKFAEILEVEEAHLSRVLSGKQEPSKNFIEKTLVTFGKSFEELFEIKEDSND